MFDILYLKSFYKKRPGEHERRTEWDQWSLPISALEGNDFVTGATHVRVDVECLPEMVDGAGVRPRTDVEKNVDVWLENGAKWVEEPPMRIDLLLILLLEADDYLHGDDALIKTLNLVRFRDRDCFLAGWDGEDHHHDCPTYSGGILVYMRGDRFAIDYVSCDSLCRR